MSPTTHDDLEGRLRELFDRQAGAMHVTARAFDDPPMATVTTLAPRRPRSAVAVILSTAAAVALVVGVVAIAPGRNGVFVGGQPGSPAALDLSTSQVSLAAAAMAIEAGGHRFTAGGSTVDLNSDPGTPDKYTTIELAWTESGVEMRLNIYFTSDGHDWWASEIRTYNGKSPGDWIEYTGQYFRTPLGTAFTGNVDLSATGTEGHLHFSNLRLQPFLPPAACTNATSKFAFDIAYDHVKMPNDRLSGFGLGEPTLLDTATCTRVANPHSFVFSLDLTTPGVAGIDTGNNRIVESQNDIDASGSIQLSSVSAGSTIAHFTARERSTGTVVATADIPVVVG